jgi:hypothetical protein
VGKLLPLQEKFKDDPQWVADTYRFAKRYVSRCPRRHQAVRAQMGSAFPPAAPAHLKSKSQLEC